MNCLVLSRRTLQQLVIVDSGLQSISVALQRNIIELQALFRHKEEANCVSEQADPYTFLVKVFFLTFLLALSTWPKLAYDRLRGIIKRNLTVLGLSHSSRPRGRKLML